MTGNPVECVIHPDLWNKSKIWDPMGVGQFYEDQYEEEYVGYPITSVSNPCFGCNSIPEEGNFLHDLLDGDGDYSLFR